MTVESPCIRVCRIQWDSRDVPWGEQVCTGCGRTVDEVMDWKRMTPIEQWIIKDKAKERLRERDR